MYLYCALSSEKLWPSISWAELHSGYINDLMLISQYVHHAGKVCVFMKQLISTGLKGDFLLLFTSIATDLPVFIELFLNFCVNSKTVDFEEIHPKLKVMSVLHKV